MLVEFAELQRRSGLRRITAVIHWLRRENIGYIRDAAGRPMTTLDAIERAVESRTRGAGWEPDYGAATGRSRKARQVLPASGKEVDPAQSD